MKMSTSCDICCDKFTSKKRKEIKCVYCDKSACIQCIEKYLLDSIHAPHCMYCKKEYSYDFQIDNFNKSLIKRFKTHQSHIHFEREKTLLPEAQQHLENLARVRDIDRQISELKETIRDMQTTRYNILNGHVKLERIKITRPCPANDCRGFLNTQWKCGVCNTKFCNKCHDKLSDGHVCDPDKVKSAELIKKQCKNCPKCGVNTFKISGCPQMWCTSCNTAWNWNTGRIETGIIHNPHYFEYLRKTQGSVPRNPNDIRCGGLPRYYIFRTELPLKYRYISEYIRFIRHIELYEIDKLDSIIDKTNLDLRVKFLQKNIDESRFKSTLKSRNTRKIKATENKNILVMFSRVLSDLIINLGTKFSTMNKQGVEADVQKIEWCNTFDKELQALLDYTNKNLEIFGARFNTKYQKIRFAVTRGSKNYLTIGNN